MTQAAEVAIAALMAAILAAGLWLAGEPLHPSPAIERTQH